MPEQGLNSGSLLPISQTPRLSGRLRALPVDVYGHLNGGHGLPTPDVLFIESEKIYSGRKKRVADSGRASLESLVFGDTSQPVPKHLKKELEKFISSVLKMLGDDSSVSISIYKLTEVCWKALVQVSPGITGGCISAGDNRGGSEKALISSYKSVLRDTFAHQLVDESAMMDVIQKFQELSHEIETKLKETLPVLDHNSTDQHVQQNVQQQAVRKNNVLQFMLGMDIPEWDLGNGSLQKGLEEFQKQTTEHVPTVTEDEIQKAHEDAFGGRKGIISNKDVNAIWLQDWIKRVQGPQYDPEDESLQTSVALAVMSASLSDDMLAAELFDLLGEGIFDYVEQIVLQRRHLRTNLGHTISEIRAEEQELISKSKTSAPSHGPSISIMSESEKAILKAERKTSKKMKKHGTSEETGTMSDGDWLSMHGLTALIQRNKDDQYASQRIILGNGMEFRIGNGDEMKGALPKGTKREVFKGYEEVKVPATTSGLKLPQEALIRIEELPDWAQLAFVGYKTLNRIQSRIFPSAFMSNENLLVCAPTGAGKTNIAMMCILREISQNLEGDDIQTDAFKVVYVAPMKALAAEVTSNFARRLEPLGLTVRELTGDMQLSKREMEECQMIVTTPEKWDVITRKGGEVSVSSKVKLLIIDEVHLLNDDRGSVIETLVARTTRQVETSQSMIRIVGLSATLPNYGDVAEFLGVNMTSGLFYFDASYRPVPLETSFVGVSERNLMARRNTMDEICYQKVVESLRRGHQAMVFVHSRKDTGKTARMLVMKSKQYGDEAIFDCSGEKTYALAVKDARKSKNKELLEVFDGGIGIHHAGMLRSDRSLMERFFASGMIKVLCCTATLAWGVNLPAHTVIIKGTELYNPQKGGFTDLGMLDVQQIFGRAGRPQFQDSGEASILTSHDKLAHYLGMITHSVPIESKFTDGLVDHLNAEVVLGTVTNVREAITWLGYTYLFVRMKKNPLVYGISWEELGLDPQLVGYRRKLVIEAARELDRARMVRFDEKSGNIYTAEMGRVASHFYISTNSIEIYHEHLKPHMNEEDILYMISLSSEFGNLNVRDEEIPELDELSRACPYQPKGGPESKHGKANILLQTYISRSKVDSFSLIADLNYAAQNAPRISRALFEICMNKSWPSAAELCLTMAKSFELQLWSEQHPLWQFESHLKTQIIQKIDDLGFDLLQLKEMGPSEIGSALRHPAAGPQVVLAVRNFPMLTMEATIMPITRTVLQIKLNIKADFKWSDAVHGSAVRWHIWVEDSDNEKMYHSEMFILTKQMWREGSQKFVFAVPIPEPMPSQYYLRALSDTWLGSESTIALSFKGLLLPQKYPPHSELLDLRPLPKTALQNSLFEEMYRFSHFNPIQTQAFHTLYHTDENVLLGAPTGSGKTISAELSILRLITTHSKSKAVFIAPLKALVKERVRDWGSGLAKRLNLRLVELTGDITPDINSLISADIIITTPEKWDGISRGWQTRPYVRTVGLVIMDEIHLLGADRGPVLEVIVSRMRYISASTGVGIRFVGLSTALANATDLADWLGVSRVGLFNFKPSVRPVPLECHIQGYPGKFYCPRMATMNKPAYAAIQTHSPSKPVLIFVASRRQTRLTALDLITYAAADDRARTFLWISEDEMQSILDTVQDASLRHTLQFGIGIHHAGLSDSDRTLVERLYVDGKIQVLVATSTLAWGVNTPAHLVIVKGTEFYDAPSKRYIDYPITDVLQMMGRAGRPQFDKHGVAVIMVHEPKKSFYKKFLYEPFPVESSLPSQLPDHLNAEIVGGTITSKQDAIDYLTWTFFLRRLLQNPSYYGLGAVDRESVSLYLSGLIQEHLEKLQEAGCIKIDDESDFVLSQPQGRIAAFYYLHYETMSHFNEKMHEYMDVRETLDILSSASEYRELPVRHNEDNMNAELLSFVRYPPPDHTVDKPSCKAFLLIQAHIGRIGLPVSDYITDTRSVLENSIRILQAMVDIAAEKAWWKSCYKVMQAAQCIVQGRWEDDCEMLQLPHVNSESAMHNIKAIVGNDKINSAIRAFESDRSKFHATLVSQFGHGQAKDIIRVIARLPSLRVTAKFIINGQSPSIQVLIHRKGECSSITKAPNAYCPNYPKVKEECWWCVVVNEELGQVMALKRVSFGAKILVNLQLESSETLDQFVFTGTSPAVHLVCDSYYGLDLRIVPSIDNQSSANRG